MVKPSKSTFTFTNISAIETILGQYANVKRNTHRGPMVEEYHGDGDDHSMVSLATEPIDVPMADILQERSKRVYYFLDARKTQIKAWPNMIDQTIMGILPTTTTKSCWWDRHPFKSKPIGCPIRFTPHDEKDVYETEGYFCSFPCCKAYIISKKSEMKYKESIALLTMLYETFHNRIDLIPQAPTWKILKEYGGHLSIQEYRSSFGRVEYEETVNFKRSAIVCGAQYILERRTKALKKIVN